MGAGAKARRVRSSAEAAKFVMNTVEKELKGVERAKYFRALVEKVNDVCGENEDRDLTRSNKTADKSKYVAKGIDSTLECKQPSGKIHLKRIRYKTENYVVQRMKFVKHTVDGGHGNVVEARGAEPPQNSSECERPEKTDTVSEVAQNLKGKSYEDEKRILRDLYTSTLRKDANDEKNVTIRESRVHDVATRGPNRIASVEAKARQKCSCTRPPQPKNRIVFSGSSPKASIEVPETKGTETLQECSSQLHGQTVDRYSTGVDEGTTSTDNALCPRNSALEVEVVPTSDCGQLRNNCVKNKSIQTLIVPNSRTLKSCARLCRRNRRVRRRLVRPLCAHCQEIITDVAFFNGVQQLCTNCADRHFERVTRARLRDKPMSYREFKNIGGDTIYRMNTERPD